MTLISDIKSAMTFREYATRHMAVKVRGRHLKALCPFHGEKSPSFTIYENGYHCFGCGAHGDLIDFICKIQNCTIQDAAKYLNVTPTYKSIAPLIPADDWEEYNHVGKYPNLKRFDHAYAYMDEAGKIIRFICRFDNYKGQGKLMVPLTYGKLNGKMGWWAKHSKSRGLYGLQKLVHPGTVILTEGEKAADAAQQLYPARHAVTWAGGSNNIHKADFTPLAGRRVILWPDADPPGIAAMDKVEAILRPLGCRIKRVRVADLPHAFDVADLQTDNQESWLQARLRHG